MKSWKKWFWSPFLLFGLAIFFVIAKSHPEDEQEYRELVHPSSGEGEKMSTQMRQKVRKDIYITDEESRHHGVIHCDKSNLVIIHGSKQGELAEKMQKISCKMQEGDTPSQPLFCFEADSGIFYYLNNRFQAHRAIFKLREKNTLGCNFAELDQSLQKGVFIGGIDTPFALFQGEINGFPLEIKSKQFQIVSDGSFVDILTDEQVWIEYDKKFRAVADSASYRCKKEGMEEGIVRLKSKGVQNTCQMTHEKAGRMQAKQIWMELEKGSIHCDFVQGTLHLPDAAHSEIDFAAKNLIWKEKEGLLTLTDEVHISCEQFGMICSDSVVFEYSALEPKRIEIQGNVKMRNQFADIEGGSPLDQYALSDVVQIDLFSRKITLNANQGKRVLFFDKANHMRVSAPALTITAGTKVGKESIKGIGDVRFTFAEQELDLLRKQFPKI